MKPKPVLIVEDNDDLRHLYTFAINEEGIPTYSASNGAAALNLLEKLPHKPGLILLDLMMPVMDGWEFLRQKKARNDYEDIPVVVCSAIKDPKPEGIPLMQKPLDLDQLLNTVERYCAT